MKTYLKNLFALTEQGAKDLIKASIASFMVYTINMVPAILLMVVLDDFILQNTRNPFLYLVLSLIVLVLMYFLLSIEYDSLYNATYQESANLRVDIAERLSQLPLSYFSKHDLSDLSQTIMSDVESIEHAMSHAMGKTIGFSIFLPIIFIMLLFGNYILGLAIILPILLNFLLFYLSKKMQLQSSKRHYEQLRNNSESFQEIIEMQQDIKSFHLGERMKKILYEKMEISEKLQTKENITQVIPILLANLVMQLSLAMLLLLGLYLYNKGEISILYLIGYALASMKLKEGVNSIILNMAELFYLDARIQRIKEIRQAKTQAGEDKNIQHYSIELKNVSFAYDVNTPVLEDVSFTIKQGEVTALVGKSGCGKTTLLRLISRLYDYDTGEILIDGYDMKNISTKSLFDKISIVFQDVTLFNNSILENIRIGRKDATAEEVKQAAQLANCEEFIKKLPKSYDTFIGENGATLSGGERQRLSIARAFLKNAPIIILDEIAASLDVENENKIQQSLNLLTKDKTVVIISHRLKSIENVNKIVVLDHGKVEQIGTHEELLQKSNLYQNLVNTGKLAENFEY